MEKLNANNAQLDASAQLVSTIVESSVREIAKLSSNIGDLGYAPDFSNNSLQNQMETNYPLVTWLLNTPLSSQMRNVTANGLAPIHQDAKTGKWMIQLPFQVGTLPPDDTTGACCWVPMDIAKCGDEAPIDLLCLKDCEQLLDNFINSNRKGGPNDLINYFLRQGESVKDARKRMAKLSMAFYTAHNIILGVSNAGTKVLKPFHGLLEVLEGKDVIKLLGTNVLGAFENLGCRHAVLGDGNYVAWVHPLVKTSIASLIVKGKNGEFPAGWTRNGDQISYENISIQADKMVPVDITAGTGEAWILDGQTTGAYLATDLSPAEQFIRHGFTSTDDPANGCASECDFYYNYGSTFNTNPNKLAIITDIPLSTSCQGDTLQGLDNLIQPDTLVPMYV